ncbi:DsbA family protein [Asticcacaulis endophyticus]|uniref:DsbA family protein n=1 Tax=Asticcacaulis endophyticus TaxID=1395890 RepID=A0A918Q4T2_9CAUL|nr:DsbA family protein [Asticcacaulis endophyticus]GGZ30819.1 DsbA family protein [Asticcacaulis endophyticus]
MLITYLFDPLCGWCYGASPALDKLAGISGAVIELAPTGLFSGSGARPMDRSFSAYAWSNDQRIARLTDQTFSDDYRNNVLENFAQMFDSGPATLALTAANITQPDRERDALKAIQTARYVEGRDVSSLPVLSDILASLGLTTAANALLAPDEALVLANRQRIDKAQSLMHEFNATGVPALIIERDGKRYPVLTSALFGGLEALVTELTREGAASDRAAESLNVLYL